MLDTGARPAEHLPFAPEDVVNELWHTPVTPDDVAELMDLTVVGRDDTGSMATLQLRGIAALYNILCAHPVAYLADEVGMGKTYQALGLAALVWNHAPAARILFVSPRENLQVKWVDDYKRFFAANYRRAQGVGDDLVTSVLFRDPVHRPVKFDNLRSWTPGLGMPERIAPFLRHTSFMRPVFVTREQARDPDALWRRVEQRLFAWGLFDAHRPADLDPENASSKLNLAFADALHRRLNRESPDAPYFDLVIVDESQCLRNPLNQTNTVLYRSLRGHVRRWLFLSATPAHGGPGDLATVLNHYPDAGEILDESLANDLAGLQEALQPIMVRRQRQYTTCNAGEQVGKDRYRRHDLEGWGVRDESMTALGTLAMGLVQKGLVDVLAGRSNRYRIGFLSSFESLQRSLSSTLTPDPGEAHDRDDATNDESSDDRRGDWHREQADAGGDAEAPDSGFIDDLTTDFECRFGFPLPHPKVDAVVNRVAPLAFGTDTEPGGEKFLIFTRRVSTVETLRDRFTAAYLRQVESRVQRVWNGSLTQRAWHTGRRVDRFDGGGFHADDEGVDDPEITRATADDNPLREAMATGGWLHRFRQTFRGTGRNALVFEDGWLSRLCVAGGTHPADVAARLPDALWAESWTHASRSAGERRSQHRADRVRYLAVQAVRRCPEVFGLASAQADAWRSAYEAALHAHLDPAEPADDPHRAPELFTEPTLWTLWDATFRDRPPGRTGGAGRGPTLALPAASAAAVGRAGVGWDVAAGRDALCQRQVARTLLGQTLRLTDALLDLYFADRAAERRGEHLAMPFLRWLASDDPGAEQLRTDCGQWLSHLRLVVDGCLDGAGQPWRELARSEVWPQLYNPLPVVGVSGGSGGHKMATRQFRTPSLPRIIVCTDTLKEGVDLHLFCDRVVHYGVAWTSGDLEQRVGRVDRFFSKIERRLASEGAPPDVQLEVGYPHVVASLERGQVERVIARQEQVERLMDSPLAGVHGDERELVIGGGVQRSAQRLAAYRPHTFPAQGHSVVRVSAERARATAAHYAAWYRRWVDAIAARGWRISPEDAVPARSATLFGPGHRHEVSWSFDAALQRYVLTLSDPPWPAGEAFTGGERRRRHGQRRVVERFVRLLVPTPDEGLDTRSIARINATLAGALPSPHPEARAAWAGPLGAVADESGVAWLSAHKARLRVARGARAHTLTAYIYDDGVRLVGVIARLSDLPQRRAWQGEPTAERVREWALDASDDLTLGYLGVHPRDGLVFGVHVRHGELDDAAKRRLVEAVAWRADAWEAALMGVDVW